MGRVIAVVGIDGSGKSSTVRRVCALSGLPASSIAVLTCPAYHETANAPFAELSRQLDLLSKLGDASKAFELKAAAMFLQMTLFGPVSRFIEEALQPQMLLCEHHPLIDTLAYGAFYQQMVRRPLDREKLESTLRGSAEGSAALDGALAWYERENRRVGRAAAFWDLPMTLREMMQAPRDALLAELTRQYRTPLPDALVLLDVPIPVALERLAARGEAGELHEQAGVLEMLRRSYLEVLAYLAAHHPSVVTVRVETSSNGSVDETVQEMLRALNA